MLVAAVLLLQSGLNSLSVLHKQDLGVANLNYNFKFAKTHDYQAFSERDLINHLRINMLLCKNVFMRTTLDLPDPLFKHLKTRAAQEGRTLRDLVIELVEKGLTARETVNLQQRFHARPVVGASAAMLSSAEALTNSNLFELVNRDDDERAEHILQSR